MTAGPGPAQAPATVEAVIEARLTDPVPLPVLAGLFCTAGDPYSVTVTFYDGDSDGEPAALTLARALLNEALTVPAAEDAIMLWREGEDTLVLVQRLTGPERLDYPGGRIRFEFPAAEVRAFLDQAYELIPAGTEPALADPGEFSLLLHLRPQ